MTIDEKLRTEKLEHALAAIVLTPHVRRYLLDHDPKLLQQACRALENHDIAGEAGSRLDDIRHRSENETRVAILSGVRGDE